MLLVASIAGASAKHYLTGKVVHVDSEQTKESRIYVIYIQEGERNFSVRLVGDPTYELEWAVEGPIEFRLEKDAICLKRANGKELKFPLLMPPEPEASLPTPDLPLPPTPQQAVKATPAVPAPSTPRTPRCAEIRAEGTQFGPLAGACEYALSPSNLPNFVCQETVQRSARSLSKSKWKHVDVVTVEVGFTKGRSDRYSKFAINGHPIKLPPDVDRGPRLMKFLSGLHTGGDWTVGEFGTVLVTVFNPVSQTVFQFDGNVDLPSGQSSAFGFHLSRANNSSYVLGIRDMRFNPGVEGSLWMDAKSGKLVRLEADATDFEPSFPSIYHSEAINYGDVPISDIGRFRLPTAAQVLECNRASNEQAPGAGPNTGGMCYKNVISFHDCGRFVAEAHIIPDTGDDH